MDFRRLNAREFASIGIRFKSDEDASLFAQIVREELEYRIGEEISRGLTKQQLAEFDSCNEDEAAKWLDINCPNHRYITKEKAKELEKEIIKYKPEIPGLVSIDETSELSNLICMEGYDDLPEE